MKVDFTEIMSCLAKAVNEQSIKSFLIEASKSSNEEIRYEVAKCCHTPAEILAKLSEDEDLFVRKGVAGNPNTPVEVLVKLSKDDYWNLRVSVVLNINTPIEIIKKLTADDDCVVRGNAKRELARRTNKQEEVRYV